MIQLDGIDDPRIVCACVSVDPGPTRSAYVYMAALRNGVIPVLRAWYVHHDRAGLWTRLALLKPGRDFLVVEAVEGEIYPGRSAVQVLANTKIEGRIEEAAEVRGWTQVTSHRDVKGTEHPYFELSQRDWRTELLGRKIMGMKPPMDPVIRAAVEAIYGDEIPPTEGTVRDARVHVYDAIGVGLVALARVTGRPILLPGHIQMKVFDAALRAKAHAVELKTRKELGLAGGPGSGRKLTARQKIQAQVKRSQTVAAKRFGR